MAPIYTKILVPLDGSALAAQALPRAEELAREMGAQLILFRVLEDSVRLMASLPAPGGMGMGDGAGTNMLGVVSVTLDDEAHQQAVTAATEALDELATSLHHRKVAAETVLDTGDPAKQIVAYADAHDIDLIVMSSHGRTGLARLAYGSVANKVLQTAPCEVKVVRATSNE